VTVGGRESVRNYAGVSFWLETGGDLTPRPSMGESIDVDVAVLGAGYSGLWTAYYLLQHEPSLRIAVLEREIAGFGASGRNGAWCSPKLSVTPGELINRYGKQTAKGTVEAIREAVDEVGRVAAREEIDAQFRKGGLLHVARGSHELPALETEWDDLTTLDLTSDCALLPADALAARIRVNGAKAALFDPHCATIHPGRLVRGLARTVERRGAVIYEQTPVEHFELSPHPRLITPQGDARAEIIVLAGEAYLSRLKPMRRQVLPIYSLIVLTEPLSEDQWANIGWEGDECVQSYRLAIDYLSRTIDGRILFGGRGPRYHFGSKIADEYDRDKETHNRLRENLIDWFPSLRGVEFSHAWGGPIGVKRDWMPTVHFDARSGLALAFGYAGQGVAVTNLAGRILAALITSKHPEYSKLPMTGHHSPKWEPEPLRWMAVNYVQRAMERLDAHSRRKGEPPTGRSLAERLARH
jgi:glycine/D-amino acid oxidase-like deaminating enzyme